MGRIWDQTKSSQRLHNPSEFCTRNLFSFVHHGDPFCFPGQLILQSCSGGIQHEKVLKKEDSMV